MDRVNAAGEHSSLIADTVSLAGSDADSISLDDRLDPPVLSHSLKHDKSILSLVVSSKFIFAGTEGGEILVSFSVLNWGF